jgi:hypothetical protein
MQLVRNGLIHKDILNKSTVNRIEIKSNNHDLKLVQSLSSIWEEERGRRRNLKMNSQPTQHPENFKREIPKKDVWEKELYSKLDKIVFAYSF